MRWTSTGNLDAEGSADREPHLQQNVVACDAGLRHGIVAHHYLRKSCIVANAERLVNLSRTAMARPKVWAPWMVTSVTPFAVSYANFIATPTAGPNTAVHGTIRAESNLTILPSSRGFLRT